MNININNPTDVEKFENLVNNENAANERLMKLIGQCKEVLVFEHEGRLFKGYFVDAVKAFIKNNPFPADMNVWFQKNYRELN